MFARLPLASLAAALVAASACSSAAAQYTIKLGGAYIDTNSSSTPLTGQFPAVNPANNAYVRNVAITSGPTLEVQNKATVVLSIERAFNDHWSAELVLGLPPKHDVKLRSSSVNVTDPLGSPVVEGIVENKLRNNNGLVVSTVRQWAPTFLVNYKFRDASARLRPFIGLGLNVTRFKARTNPTGDKLYNDGNPYIQLSDSIGPAIQAGVSYKLDERWSLNASVLSAQVDNKLVIETKNSRQEAFFRFTPTVASLSVGYSF